LFISEKSAISKRAIKVRPILSRLLGQVEATMGNHNKSFPDYVRPGTNSYFVTTDKQHVYTTRPSHRLTVKDWWINALIAIVITSVIVGGMYLKVIILG
jgi:hypothetical protein